MESQDQVSQFMAAVATDANLREKVKGTLDHIQGIAKESGFNFTHDELRQHLREKWGMKSAPKFDSSADTCFFA